MNTFNRIVCSAAPVRDAFTGYGALRSWWCMVLWLHGKPLAQNLPEAEQIQQVAKGFAFYAALYRIVAAALAVAGFGLLLSAYQGNLGISLFWPLAILAGAVYLFACTGLGDRAAREYERSPAEASPYLAIFMTMLIAFLSLFLAGASIAANHTAGVNPILNVAVTSALFVFGVGSYLIELIYVL